MSRLVERETTKVGYLTYDCKPTCLQFQANMLARRPGELNAGRPNGLGRRPWTLDGLDTGRRTRPGVLSRPAGRAGSRIFFKTLYISGKPGWIRFPTRIEIQSRTFNPLARTSRREFFSTEHSRTLLMVGDKNPPIIRYPIPLDSEASSTGVLGWRQQPPG